MCRFHTPTRILAVTLVLFAFAQAAAGEKLQLVVRTTPGDTLRYRMQMQQDLSIQGMTFAITQAGNVQFVAEPSRHDTLQFLVHFSGFEGSVRRGDELMERKPEYDGVSLRAGVSPRGEVLEIVAQSAVPVELDQLKSLLDNFFPYLAADPVEPGDTWTQVDQIPNKDDASTPKVDSKTEYTLEELTKKSGKAVARVLGKSRGKVNWPSPTGALAGDVHGESETWVGVDDGLLVEMKSSSDFAGTIGDNKGSRASSFELHRSR